MNEIPPTKLFWRESNSLRDFVHVSLEREDALRSTETSECAMRRNVRSNGLTVNPDVGADVWTSGVNRSSRKDDVRERAISTTVDHEINFHREQLAVFTYRGLVTSARRMTLSGRNHVFRAVVDDLDGLA